MIGEALLASGIIVLAVFSWLWFFVWWIDVCTEKEWPGPVLFAPLAVVIWLLLAVVLSAAASAQTTPVSPESKFVERCKQPENQDRWSLEPNPEAAGEYLFTYTNGDRCSLPLEAIEVVAEDGFTVALTVIVSYGDDGEELIWVSPPAGYQAYPAELVLQDGAPPQSLRLIPGVS